MVHGKVCPCPNCSGGGGFVWLVILGAVLLAVATGSAAAAIAPLVHAIATGVLTGILCLSAIGVGVVIAVSSRHDRRWRANSARQVPENGPAAESFSEPQRVRWP